MRILRLEIVGERVDEQHDVGAAPSPQRSRGAGTCRGAMPAAYRCAAMPSALSPSRASQPDAIAQVGEPGHARDANGAQRGRCAIARSLNGRRCVRCRWCSASIFIFAMSTPVGTFAPAALAAHAQVERVADRLRRSAVRSELSRQREPQRVRAPARQMLLVARDAKARAHRAGVELAAVAVVVAHLDGLGEAAARDRRRCRRAVVVFGDRIVLHVPRRPVERRHRSARRDTPGGKRNSVASSIRGRPHDLAGIHQACGIEQRLDLLERARQPRPELPARPIRCAPARRRARRRTRPCTRAPSRSPPRRSRASSPRRRGACRGWAARAACRPTRARTTCRACRASRTPASAGRRSRRDAPAAPRSPR